MDQVKEAPLDAETADALAGMTAMIDEIRAAPAIYRPSEFWDELCATNIRMLKEHGIERIKLSLAQNYFNWLVISPRNAQFRRAVRLWLLHPTMRACRARFGALRELWTTLEGEVFPFTWLRRTTYRLFVGMLWMEMCRRDKTGLGKRLEEPEAGSPIPVTLDGKRISQDLANSIIECNVVVGMHGDRAPEVIAELGAGYGRLAHVFVSLATTKRYCIIDIPPALMVSQWYLRKIFPGKKVFHFRHFDNFASVAEEYMASDIAFFTPNQIDMLPENSFSSIVSISTFPEMTVDQVKHYLLHFTRLASESIFIKQWKRWKNPRDGTDLTIDDYRLGDPWRCILEQEDPIMPAFFNMGWLRSASQ